MKLEYFKTKFFWAGIMSLALAFMYTYVGALKLMDIKSFKDGINNQPIDNQLTVPLMVAIITAEATIIALLLINKWRFYGFLLSILILTLFSTYIIVILTEKVFDFVPCTCGGGFDQLSWQQQLDINIAAIVLSLIGAIILRPIKKSKLKANNEKFTPLPT